MLRDTIALLEKASEVRKVFDPDIAHRSFRIPITDISEIVPLPTLLNHLRRLVPNVRIEAENISRESPRRLESGEVDIAVGLMPDLDAGFYQQTLFTQDFVCLAAKNHPRARGKPGKVGFLRDAHMVVTSSGTGHSIVARVLAQQGIKRNVALRLLSFLGVARIVAQTELLVIVPRRLGDMLALQEAVVVLEPPVSLPSYSVKQHWHERFHADSANVWLRRTLSDLFSRPA